MSAVQNLSHGADRAEIPQPEPGLTPTDVIARAAALIPALRDEQDSADARGHYSEAMHNRMRDAGLYRIVQPRKFGGYQFDFTTMLKVVQQIGRGHPASAWCYCLSTTHAMVLASHWPEETQREYFGPDGDFRAPHRAVPTGTWDRVDGGWKVSGTWSYSSGIPYATHFAGGAMIPNEAGKIGGVNFFVPRENLTVLPDWGGDSALGMQGSGSNSVRLENVFVPDRAVVRGDVLFGIDIDFNAGTVGTALHDDPMYLGVFGGIYHLCFSAIYSGAARAALDEYEHIIRTRKAFGAAPVTLIEDGDVQRTLGDVLTKIDCAEAILWGAMEHWDAYLDRWKRTGAPITENDTMRLWAMGRQSTFMSCSAIESMFATSTPRGANRGEKLQRYLRDVQMFRIHPSSQPWVTEARGQTHLGRPPARFAARR